MSIRQKLHALYWWLESLIDPGTRSSQYRYAELLDSLIADDSVWLDVGCGHSVFPEWIPGQDSLVRRARKVVGIDYDWPSLRKHRQIARLVVGDSACLPFRSAVFNRVTANMVVEHMAEPGRTLQEIHRVLQPDSLFIYHTPNVRFYFTSVAARVPQWIKNKLVWLMEGRDETDVFPTHYRMNRLSAIHQLADQSGFGVPRCESLNTSSAGNIFLGPFVILELLIRRLLGLERFREFRSNFIVVLKKKFTSDHESPDHGLVRVREDAPQNLEVGKQPA